MLKNTILGLFLSLFVISYAHANNFILNPEDVADYLIVLFPSSILCVNKQDTVIIASLIDNDNIDAAELHFRRTMNSSSPCVQTQKATMFMVWERDVTYNVLQVSVLGDLVPIVARKIWIADRPYQGEEIEHIYNYRPLKDFFIEIEKQLQEEKSQEAEN